ncbi:MAG: hypothetical protein LUH05_07640 [Candidatus Gastranaerophilales bacterium]|nr:hypothetical protein [Candidatus Gastranaerophilales bacterium]
MTNLLNSQIPSNYNQIPARKLSKDAGRCANVVLPQSLPKFSVDDEMQKQDEFRKSAIQNMNAQQGKSKKNLLCKSAFILASIAGVLLLKKKNKI